MSETSRNADDDDDDDNENDDDDDDDDDEDVGHRGGPRPKHRVMRRVPIFICLEVCLSCSMLCARSLSPLACLLSRSNCFNCSFDSFLFLFL